MGQTLGTEPSEIEHPSDEPEIEEIEGQQDQEVEQTEPQYLTADQLNETLERFGNQIIQRVGQSTNDRIRTQLAAYDRMVKLQEQTGAPISPEAQAQARRAIQTGAAMLEDAGQQQQQQAGPVGVEDWSEYLAQQVDEVFKVTGVRIKPGEPEWKAIEEEWRNPNGSPAKLVLATQAAVAAKKTRIASKSDKARQRAGVGPGKPVPPGDISKITDPTELYRMGEEQIRKGRG